METQDRHNQALMQLVRHQQQSTAALTLPQPSMQVFSGDPIYFIYAFEHLVEQKTTSSSSRLYYLVQYTCGPAQELMRSCLSKQEEEGYVEARRLLKERYGRSYKMLNDLSRGHRLNLRMDQCLSSFPCSVQAASIR